jgi:hypothetical protein
MTTYQVIFTAEAEFAVEVEAESDYEAIEKFRDDEVDWNTIVSTGNWLPSYVENPAEGEIQSAERR